MDYSEPQLNDHNNFDQVVGQKIMVGFKGTSTSDPEVQELGQLIKQGKVGGVIFFAYNLKNPAQIKALTHYFHNIPTSHPVLLAIDQEGGKVQRLSAKNGYRDFPSAKQVSVTNDAKQVYTDMAQIVEAAGFNTVLGPVLDIEYDPQDSNKKLNPVIGKIERSYGADSTTILNNASAFITAMHQQHILTSLKHFPGHGLAHGDTHQGFVDVTNTFKSAELAPYVKFIHSHPQQIDMIMTAHIMHKKYDQKYPVTLSPVILDTLLRQNGYNGVIISDCLYMGAITKNFSFEETVTQSTLATVDIMIFSRNNAASINTHTQQQQISLTDFVNSVHDIIKKQVANNKIPYQVIENSYQRIKLLKKKLK